MCACVCVYACIYACMYMCVRVYVHVCVYVCELEWNAHRKSTFSRHSDRHTLGVTATLAFRPFGSEYYASSIYATPETVYLFAGTTNEESL